MTGAVVFPGQGAQAVGMGRELAEAVPESRALFDRAAEVLGYDLAKLCFEGPIEKLTDSSHAQPAIFVVSIACLRAFESRARGAAFAASAGLSSGEWAALCAAGAISFDDAVRVLRARGEFMQEACRERPGAMTSVLGLAEGELDRVCAESGAEAANFNSPEQTVLSGPKDAIERAERLAATAGARRVLRLNVAGAFHSSLMESAARRLDEFLRGIPFLSPRFPVVSNVTGLLHGSPDEIRRLMVRQVTSSVRWVSCVRTLQQAGIRRYVECGPGKVLTGLVRRIDKEAAVHNIQDRSSLEATVGAWSGG
jgi:[acyl-carrier-protein] S-malonyltransferase